MISYPNLLSRMDNAWFQDKLGPRIVRILQALDDRNNRTNALRTAFEVRYPPRAALANPSIRNGLFEALRLSEAEELAIGLKLKGEPYLALKNCKLRNDSANFNDCCEFFGLPLENKSEISEPESIEQVISRYSLFNHQLKAVENVWLELNRRPARVVLHMPTGAGKTRVAMHVVCRHLIENAKAVVTWLANSEELCEQAAAEFRSAWESLGNQQAKIYRLWGNRNIPISDIDHGLVIGGFAKLYSIARNNPPQIASLGDRTTLLVIDEAHQAVAPSYDLVINAIAARHPGKMPVLGLTATPGRTWNDLDEDRKLSNFFNRTKVTLSIPGFTNPVEYLINEGYLARPIFRKFGTARITSQDILSLESHLDIPKELLTKLAEDELRTIQIISEAEKLCKRHKRIIIFATTVAHCFELTSVLTVQGIECKCVTGESISSERSQAIEWFKEDGNTVRVLVNFGVLTTGFDAPKTSAALIARPTISLVLYSQMVGRALRGPKAGGSSAAEIVTVGDIDRPGFGDLGSAFNNWEDIW